MAVTIKDIAKHTGLGLATISSYLNGGRVREQNRIKIEAAIEELHFEVNEVARGLKTNRTKTVGVVIPELCNVFFAEIVTIIEDILRNYGYAMMICDCRSDSRLEKESVDFLYRKRIDGIINIPVSADASNLKSFVKTGKPIVLVDRKIVDIDCDCVLVDNLAAAKGATKQLLACGHKKIGMIGGPKEVFTAQERFMGYQLALLEAGIPHDDNLVVHSDYTIEGGVKALKTLINSNPEMTAVFVANYETTVGTLIGTNEMGISIPEQLSIIGYDNVEFAKAVNPRLTIVTQPTREMAEQAADLMLHRLSGNVDKPKVVKLSTSMVEGKSVLNLS